MINDMRRSIIWDYSHIVLMTSYLVSGKTFGIPRVMGAIIFPFTSVVGSESRPSSLGFFRHMTVTDFCLKLAKDSDQYRSLKKKKSSIVYT